MSTNSQDQEINLGQVGAQIKSLFNGIIDSLFDFLFFIKKKIIIVVILFVLGLALGIYLDSKPSYIQKLILIPNFGSNEYLYNKVDLLKSKLKEKDKVFFKSIGITNSEDITKMELEPLNGIYGFINSKENALNFEFIKLMAEDGNLEKVIKEDITSRNFQQHILIIKTTKSFKKSELIDKILNFLQDSEHFNKLQAFYVKNVNEKVEFNKTLVEQINILILSFSQNKNTSSSVSISENSGLSDIINKKDELIKENQYLLSNYIEYDKIIKDQNVFLNELDTSGIKNKLKFILPFIFVLLYLGFYKFTILYKKQLARINK